MSPAAPFKRLLSLALLLGLCTRANAQAFGSVTDTAAIRSAVLAALASEQAAFAARDCETSVSHFADLQPLFIVSGRVIPSRAILSMACRQMVGTRGGAPRELDRHVIHVLSNESAFSVSIYRLAPHVAGAPPTRQVVTKVWILRGGAWQIGHLHESAGPWTAPGPAGGSAPPA